ncbi:MAG TPA: hypothetical protein VM580_12185 [Labilithrix sp.]|nr:hypothetical protein [Labilithrix sp.]
MLGLADERAFSLDKRALKLIDALLHLAKFLFEQDVVPYVH